MRRQVVLPDPEGPSIEKNSPSRTSRSMPSTATTSPKRFSTWSRRTAAGSSAAWAGADVVRETADGPDDDGAVAAPVVRSGVEEIGITQLLVFGSIDFDERRQSACRPVRAIARERRHDPTT